MEADWRQQADKAGLWFSENVSLTNPYRAEQMAALMAMIPFADDAEFKIVDVGCGDGRLARCLLTLFPKCIWVGLEGSAQLRTIAADRLKAFGSRATVLPFRFRHGAFEHEEEWRPFVQMIDVVVASHFNIWIDESPELSKLLMRGLSDSGAVLIAEMSRAETRGAAQWWLSDWLEGLAAREGLDEAQTEAVEAWRQNLSIYYKQWDDFQHNGDPTAYEKLKRLHDSGLSIVDIFWLRAGHCVYGGLRRSGYGFDEGRRERALKMAYEAFAL